MPALVPEVTKALQAAQTAPEDVAAVALAVRYAELLDEAAVSQQYAEAVKLVDSALDQGNPLVARAWSRIVSALAEHSTASDLGPKLLAALTSLGATPAARKDAAKGGAKVVNLPASPLTALRDAARARNAASMDATA